MAQSIPYDGYPADGARATRIEWAGDHVGPGPTQGNYQGGGYSLTASSLGMSRIESASFSARSSSGNYFAQVTYGANTSANNEARAVPPASVTVKWYVASNSAEVANNTNLSAEITKLTAIGI